jgi:integrase
MDEPVMGCELMLSREGMVQENGLIAYTEPQSVNCQPGRNLGGKLWDVYDLAAHLSVPVSWVYDRTRREGPDRIPHIKLGRYARFDPESPSLRAWLDRQTIEEYDARHSEKDGPRKESDTMARTSYQKGTIKARKRKQGTVWVLRYRLRAGDSWTEKTEALEGCSNRKEARKAADQRMLEINRLNSSSHALRMTLKEFIDGPWKNYVAQRSYKQSTSYGYRSLLTNYIEPHLGGRLLSAITPNDVTVFFTALENQEVGGKYLANVYSLAKLVFEVACQFDLIESSPVRPKLHRPKWEREPKPTLTPEQIRAVFDHIEDEGHRCLFFVVALTGLRVGELLGLRWQNIDLEARTLTVTHSLWRRALGPPKTRGSQRVLYLAPALFEALSKHRLRARWIGPDDFVFCRVDGSPCDPDTLRRRVLYPALDAAEIKRTSRGHGFHLFRHSAGTILHAATRDVKVAQEILGHSRIETTANIYTHTERRVVREATEVLAREIVGNCGPTVAESSDKVQ